MERVERCKRIATAVEMLGKTEMEEMFRIIHRHKYDYTRNNHGVFINLSWIPERLLRELEAYIQFCQCSKQELQRYESICDALNSKMAACTRKDVAPKPLVVPRGARKVALSQPVASSVATPAGDVAVPEEGALVPQEGTVALGVAAKVSSSMRFYLLKKKYAKMGTLGGSHESDLKSELYPITS